MRYNSWRTAVSGFIIIALILTAPAALADYSSRAYGGNKDTTFNKVTDWFATLGKSRKEKRIILKERRAARKIARAKERIRNQKRKSTPRHTQ